MNFETSEEQKLLRESLRRYLAHEYDFETRRKIVRSELGYSRTHWRQLAELGILGMTFPEAHGGLDGTPVDTMLVMEALGRALVVEPYLSTVVLCGTLLRDAGTTAQKAAALPAIAAGKLVLALAHDEPGARPESACVAARADHHENTFVLNGQKTVVLHGAQADQLLVTARHDAGVSLFLVDRDAEGLEVTGYSTHDGQRAADLRLSNVRVTADALVGPRGQAQPLVERAVQTGIAALCAEAVGAMDTLNELTLDYLKTRKQFGVPIGKFQALQHRVADMFIATEQARSMAIVAAVKVRSEDPVERRYMISAAKALIGQSARFVGQQAVQLHGGMGVTDELPAAHYFKRLTVINLTLGDADHHLGQVSDLLLPANAAAR